MPSNFRPPATAQSLLQLLGLRHTCTMVLDTCEYIYIHMPCVGSILKHCTIRVKSILCNWTHSTTHFLAGLQHHLLHQLLLHPQCCRLRACSRWSCCKWCCLSRLWYLFEIFLYARAEDIHTKRLVSPQKPQHQCHCITSKRRLCEPDSFGFIVSTRIGFMTTTVMPCAGVSLLCCTCVAAHPYMMTCSTWQGSRLQLNILVEQKHFWRPDISESLVSFSIDSWVWLSTLFSGYKHAIRPFESA